MTRLALRSLSVRKSAFAAAALSVFLGATVILAFLSLLETALVAGVSPVDRETLATMAIVVGSWGLVIVVFSVASTLGVTVRQRAGELSLLRTIGTTRRQIRRMVLREAVVVAGVASLLAIVPGWLLGRMVLRLVERADMVAATVDHRIGVASIGVTLVALVPAAGFAALLAARRGTSGSAQSALTASNTGRARLGGWRIALGVLFLALGASCSTLTVTVMADSDDPFAAMSTAGPASIFWSIGLAAFAPVLLRVTARVCAGVLGRSGVAGFLALFTARQRSHQLSGALVPVIIFTGISTGTPYLMAVENAAVSGVQHVEAQNIELLNYVVVGMISAFAAIMVVNTLIATVSDRRREFGLQRLTGSTPGQVTAMVAQEGLLIAAAGIVFGGLASLGTTIPYAIVKTDGWLPGAGPWLFVAVCVVAVAVVLLTAIGATRRAIRTPAVDALAA